MIRLSPSRRPCSRSAGSASTRRSCSPTSSSCPTRSARASPSNPAMALASTRSATPRAWRSSSHEPDWNRLAPVFEALDRLKTALPNDVALIGFCGAPWTVASYMIAGRGTPDQAPARLFAYRHPDLFAVLIDRLVDASAEYLCRQLAAGAEAVQIFDSWAGVLPPAEFDRWCVAPIAALAAKVRAKAPHAPIIAFPRGAGTQLAKFAGFADIDAIGLDTAVEPRAAIAALPERLALAGQSRSAGARRRRQRASIGRSTRVLEGFRAPRPYFQSRPRRPARDARRTCRATGRSSSRRTGLRDRFDA